MKALRLFILSVLCLMMALPSMANDGTYYTRGNQLVPLQETDISVKKEVLTICLMDNGFARVDVQYEFWNPGSARRITMGFEADPPYNFDYKFYPDGVHPSISLFTVEMNGHQLSYRNAACVLEENRNCKLPLRYIDTTKRYYVNDDNYLYEDKGNKNPTDNNTGFPFAYVYYFDADFQPGLNRQRVIRNLPFANRGHVFKDKRLREYFEGLWWYMPDPTYDDDTSDFTPVDWEFVNYKED